MSMANTAPKPRPTARFAKMYAGAWMLLASLALAYMVTLAVKPSVLGDWTPGRSEPETNEGQRSVARFATDLNGLKQTVGDIQKDVTQLRTTATASAAREKEIIDRLAAVEERTKVPAVADLSVPAPPKTAAQRQAEARAKKLADKATATQSVPVAALVPNGGTELPAAAVAEPKAASPPVTVLNAAAPLAAPASPIATGSIALPPPAQGVPAPPPPTAAQVPSFGPGAIKATVPSAPAAVELASGPSLDALRLNWSLLAEQNSGALKSLEPRYTNGGEGQPYQLVAGPLGSTEDANRLCAQLKAKRVACRVTGFGGNAL